MRVTRAKEYARRRIDPEHVAQINNSVALYRARRSDALDAVPFFQAMAITSEVHRGDL
jgi:hypothetical protein